MNYLELVQEAMKSAGVREDAPSAIAGATGIVSDFIDYVDKTYRRIQTDDHGENWFFRQSLDLTLALVAAQDEYAIPSGLQELNWRTITVYLTAKQDETPLVYRDYYDWRTEMDTRAVADNRPQWITQKPDDLLALYPAPDQIYTMRFDGVLDVDEMSVDADVPILPVRYHWVIVWGAVMRYAAAHEDGTKLAEAKSEFRPIYDSLVERQLPDTRVITGHLYGVRRPIRL